MRRGPAHRRRRATGSDRRRHAIAPHPVRPVSATRAMTVLHATEPATVYLSLHGRIDGLTVADVDTALYDERSLVKQLAMRRTLFVFPARPAAGGLGERERAGRRPARGPASPRRSRRPGSPTTAPPGWTPPGSAVLARLADGSELSAAGPAGAGRRAGRAHRDGPGQDVRRQLPDRRPGCSPRLGVEAQIVRGRNGGHWRVSRPKWTLMRDWLGENPSRGKSDEGYAELVGRWLRTFGPGHAARHPVVAGRHRRDREAGARRRRRGAGLLWTAAGSASCCPTTSIPVPEVEPWAALLPVLDPTVMGWKERGFYLGPHAPSLFDTQRQRGRRPPGGTAGSSAAGSRIEDAVVRVVLLEDVGRDAQAALDVEADRLTTWLDGVKIGSVYSSPAMKAAHRLTAAAGRLAWPPVRAHANNPSNKPRRSSGCGSVRQARPAPVHQPPRLLSRAFERAVVRARIPMAYSSGFNPASADLVRRGGADGVGQRGGVPRDRAGPGGRPGRRPPGPVRVAARPGSMSSRWWCRRAAPWPTSCRPATGRSTCDADLAVPRRKRSDLPGPGVQHGRADDQEGAARVSTAGPPCWPSRRCRAPAARPSTWCCATPCPPYDPTTYSPVWPPIAGLQLTGAPLLTRLAQGPLDEATQEIGDPLGPTP